MSPELQQPSSCLQIPSFQLILGFLFPGPGTELQGKCMWTLNKDEECSEELKI